MCDLSIGIAILIRDILAVVSEPLACQVMACLVSLADSLFNCDVDVICDLV